MVYGIGFATLLAIGSIKPSIAWGWMWKTKKLGYDGTSGF
jgi:hypothetical protein